jgi:hypothetical protein
MSQWAIIRALASSVTDRCLPLNISKDLSDHFVLTPVTWIIFLSGGQVISISLAMSENIFIGFQD